MSIFETTGWLVFSGRVASDGSGSTTLQAFNAFRFGSLGVNNPLIVNDNNADGNLDTTDTIFGTDLASPATEPFSGWTVEFGGRRYAIFGDVESATPQPLYIPFDSSVDDLSIFDGTFLVASKTAFSGENGIYSNGYLANIMESLPMSTVQSSTELFREATILEANAARGDYDIDGRHEEAIARFSDFVFPNIEPVLNVLSSTLIQLSFNESPTSVYQLSLQGSGIGPVSSLDALSQAIEAGVASGALGAITLTQNGVSILSLNLTPGGYTLTSGVDVFRLTGAMPTTFGQIAQLADLLSRFDTATLDMMLSTERAAYFADLAAFSISGISLETNGTQIASLSLTTSTATLQLDGLVITINGELPANLGAAANVLYDIHAQFTRMGQEVDLSQLSGLDINSLVVTGTTGTELLRLTGPFTTEQNIASHTITGTAGDDEADLLEVPFALVGLLEADFLGGNDTAILNLTDLFDAAVYNFFPGSVQTQVSVNGGVGTDQLVLQNYNYMSGAIVDIEAGEIRGFNVANPLTEPYSVDIEGFEEIVLRGQGFGVIGDSGNNIVRISSEFWQGPLPFYFMAGAGLDLLDLSGTTLVDEAFLSFQGIDRSALDQGFVVTPDGGGGLRFDPNFLISNVFGFSISDVEQLELRTATGTEIVNVADLVETDYTVSSFTAFTGSYLDDRITGTEFSDTIDGANGVDTIIGGEGDDFLFGGTSENDLRDVIYAGDGNDSLDGGWGNDELHGGNGNDTVLGNFGADTLIGNAGDDVISGAGGSDAIFGGPGNDTINGGFGFDRLNGGDGADRFYHQGVISHGSDWIQDYEASEGDVLVFGNLSATRDQFQVNVANTPSAGDAGVAEAFVIYRPTQQIMWALVDGDGQSSINIQLNGQVFDLLA